MKKISSDESNNTTGSNQQVVDGIRNQSKNIELESDKCSISSCEKELSKDEIYLRLCLESEYNSLSRRESTQKDDVQQTTSDTHDDPCKRKSESVILFGSKQDVWEYSDIVDSSETNNDSGNCYYVFEDDCHLYDVENQKRHLRRNETNANEVYELHQTYHVLQSEKQSTLEKINSRQNDLYKSEQIESIEQELSSIVVNTKTGNTSSSNTRHIIEHKFKDTKIQTISRESNDVFFSQGYDDKKTYDDDKVYYNSTSYSKTNSNRSTKSKGENMASSISRGIFMWNFFQKNFSNSSPPQALEDEEDDVKAAIYYPNFNHTVPDPLSCLNEQQNILSSAQPSGACSDINTTVTEVPTPQTLPTTPLPPTETCQSLLQVQKLMALQASSSAASSVAVGCVTLATITMIPTSVITSASGGGGSSESNYMTSSASSTGATMLSAALIAGLYVAGLAISAMLIVRGVAVITTSSNQSLILNNTAENINSSHTVAVLDSNMYNISNTNSTAIIAVPFNISFTENELEIMKSLDISMVEKTILDSTTLKNVPSPVPIPGLVSNPISEQKMVFQNERPSQQPKQSQQQPTDETSQQQSSQQQQQQQQQHQPQQQQQHQPQQQQQNQQPQQQQHQPPQQNQPPPQLQDQSHQLQQPPQQQPQSSQHQPQSSPQQQHISLQQQPQTPTLQQDRPQQQPEKPPQQPNSQQSAPQQQSQQMPTPTQNPTQKPTQNPTQKPTQKPAQKPTQRPQQKQPSTHEQTQKTPQEPSTQQTSKEQNATPQHSQQSQQSPQQPIPLQQHEASQQQISDKQQQGQQPVVQQNTQQLQQQQNQQSQTAKKMPHASDMVQKNNNVKIVDASYDYLTTTRGTYIFGLNFINTFKQEIYDQKLMINGTTYYYQNFGTKDLSILVDAAFGTSPVKFIYGNGIEHIENLAPFAMGGDDGYGTAYKVDYLAQPGEKFLRIEAYQSKTILVEVLELQFTILDSPSDNRNGVGFGASTVSKDNIVKLHRRYLRR